jgi:hypothetical protein
MNSKNNKKPIRKTVDNEKALVFIEDLCWLLDANRSLDFKKVLSIIKELSNSNSVDEEFSNTDNKVMLDIIGILPTLLKDETLFLSNSSIVQFATQVLHLEIPRWEKRSRFEIIGLIVCNVEETNQDKLLTLYNWVAELLLNKEKVKNFQHQNNESAFSWNDAIQRIIGEK